MQEFSLKHGSILNWILPKHEADSLLELTKTLVLTQKMGNRESGQFGCDYSYSGITVKGQVIPTWLQEVMTEINKLTNSNFNSCLVNRYPANVRTGIGFHKDDEPELKTRRVASISLGQTDVFILRGTDTLVLELEHGDVLLMGEPIQDNYWHGIEYRIKPKDRYSLTFRQFKD